MSFKVMSFNIRGAFHPEDGVNAWEKRRALNIATIQHYAPDIMGFQEAQTPNIADYDVNLPEYTQEQGLISIRQNEGRHYVPIYYRTERFEKVRSGGFYLSETPETWSIGWDSIYVRAVTWIVLRDKIVNQELFILNTHYNHDLENHHSRTQSSKLIVKQATQLGGSLPQIVTGDFNSLLDSEAYQTYIEDGYQDTFTLAGYDHDIHTVHLYQGEAFPHPHARIDWVLLKDNAKQLQVKSFEVIRDHEHPMYPSDHYPILTQLEWTPSDA